MLDKKSEMWHKTVNYLLLNIIIIMQLNLDSGTIDQRSSDSRTCHIANPDIRWRRIYSGTGTTAQRNGQLNCNVQKYSDLPTYNHHQLKNTEYVHSP